MSPAKLCGALHFHPWPEIVERFVQRPLEAFVSPSELKLAD